MGQLLYHCLKKSLFLNLPYLQKVGEFNDDFRKFEESNVSVN